MATTQMTWDQHQALDTLIDRHGMPEWIHNFTPENGVQVDYANATYIIQPNGSTVEA